MQSFWRRKKHAAVLLFCLLMALGSPAARSMQWEREEPAFEQQSAGAAAICAANSVPATSQQERRLMPGGQCVGMAIMTDGVVLVGMSSVEGADSPALKAGLRPGDIICFVNGQRVQRADDLNKLVQAGGRLQLTVRREDEELNLNATPVYDADENVYRLGAWVRDSAAGLGTITYFDPATGNFGALGHAITDMDTGINMPIAEGAIYESRIVDIHRGQVGDPGELIGNFFDAEEELGQLYKNTQQGVFGVVRNVPVNPLYPRGLPVAEREQIKRGDATVLTALQNGELREYSCRILNLYPRDKASERSMMIQITDPELLAQTGGIVQGMGVIDNRDNTKKPENKGFSTVTLKLPSTLVSDPHRHIRIDDPL